jgi:hypothetical protein
MIQKEWLLLLFMIFFVLLLFGPIRKTNEYVRDRITGGLCLHGVLSELREYGVSDPVAFEIRAFARFGHDFYQLLNWLVYCSHLHIREVFASSGFLCLNDSVVTGLAIRISSWESPFLYDTIKGHFFYARVPCVFVERHRHADSLRHLWWTNRHWAIPSTHIYMHVRSGDVFGTYGIMHPGYGQPPCRYYLEAAMLHPNMSKMFVVTDGGRNPCISQLTSNGAELDRLPVCEAIGRLAHAWRFALARGTFSISALLLSASSNRGIFYTFGCVEGGLGRHWDCKPTITYQKLILNEN